VGRPPESRRLRASRPRARPRAIAVRQEAPLRTRGSFVAPRLQPAGSDVTARPAPESSLGVDGQPAPAASASSCAANVIGTCAQVPLCPALTSTVYPSGVQGGLRRVNGDTIENTGKGGPNGRDHWHESVAPADESEQCCGSDCNFPAEDRLRPAPVCACGQVPCRVGPRAFERHESAARRPIPVLCAGLAAGNPCIEFD